MGFRYSGLQSNDDLSPHNSLPFGKLSKAREVEYWLCDCSPLAGLGGANLLSHFGVIMEY